MAEIFFVAGLISITVNIMLFGGVDTLKKQLGVADRSLAIVSETVTQLEMHTALFKTPILKTKNREVSGSKVYIDISSGDNKQLLSWSNEY